MAVLMIADVGNLTEDMYQVGDVVRVACPCAHPGTGCRGLLRAFVLRAGR
jgi:hypothetical protein